MSVLTIRPVSAGSGLAGNRLPRGTAWVVLAASLAVSLALFGLLAAADGSEFNAVGAVLAGAILYLVVSTGLSAAVEGRRRATDRLVTGLVTGAFLVAMVPLVSLSITVVANGLARLDLEFFSSSMRNVTGEGGGALHAMVGTLLITLAQLPGYAVAAWVIEKWGRRLTLSVFLVGSAASAVVFGTVHTEGAIIASGMALSFFNLGAWGALYAVTPELYPTSLRGTGAGWAAGVGRIASIVAPLVVPVMLVAGGSALTFGVFAVFFVVAAAAAWGLIEHHGKALDER